MTDQTVELPPDISDEDAFEFAASFACEVDQIVAGRNADVLRYLLQMATLEARRLAVAAAKMRRVGDKDRTAN